MGNPLKDYITITISIILFGLLLTLVVLLSQVGSSLLSIENDNRAFQQDLVKERELAFYRDTELTKDDVLIAVKKYTKEHTFNIETKDPLDGLLFPGESGRTEKGITILPQDDESLWQISQVDKDMGEEKNTKYKSSVHRNMEGELTFNFLLIE